MLKRLQKYLNPKAGLNEYLDLEGASASIRKNIYFHGPNVYILAFAVVIASVGLNVNSIPVIIGAMLVSPLMGPILGIGLSLEINDTRLLKVSLKNLAIMVIISIVASTLYFILTPLRLVNPSELLARTNPTIYDVIIALVGGLAGIMETCRKEKGTVLSGVAIATALMPPLCTIGFGVSQLDPHYIFGALYLFFINSVFIALATYLGAKYLGFAKVRNTESANRGRIITLAIIIIIIPSIYSAVTVVRQTNFERSVDNFLDRAATLQLNYVLDHNIIHEGNDSRVELVVSNVNLPSADKETLLTLADEEGITRSKIAFIGPSERQLINRDNLVGQMLSRSESRVEEQDSLILQLRKELDSYRDSDLDCGKIANEIKAQYPNIKEVVLARGASIHGDGSQQPELVAVIVGSATMTSDQKSSLANWLKVRTDCESVRLIQE
ncbi:MAG: DUF389 domain-containing protein [Bacteroidales bacterium]|nr:DUF389 domain-containing protein [Bacteroidales bacterium]